MKKLLLSIALLFFALITNAQAPRWGNKSTSPGTDYEQANGIAVDSLGNSYIIGSYIDTVKFGSITLLAKNHSQDIFVAKLDSLGHYIWAKSFGGTGVDEGFGIAVDNSGNVFCTGGFNGHMFFTPTDSLVSVGGSDMWACKLDNNGNLLLKVSNGILSNDYGRAIAVNYSNGNFAIVGDETNNLYYYVVKYNSAGSVLFSKQFAATTVTGTGVSFDNNDLLYTCGYYTGVLSTTPSTGMSNHGGIDGVVLVFSSSGTTFSRAESYGGASNDYCYGIKSEANGSAYYVCGSFRASNWVIGYDASSNQVILPGSSFYNYPFIEKAKVSNSSTIWANQYSGGTSFNCVNSDKWGNVICGSPFLETFKYTSYGDLSWISYPGGTLVSSDLINGVGTDKRGNVFCTGQFLGTKTFGDSVIAGGSGSYHSAYVEKISSPIIKSPAAGSNFCFGSTTGDSVKITFSPSMAYKAGNVFTLQYDSSGTGNFTTHLNIGTLTTTGNGTIHGFVPPGTLHSYMVFRIVSSNPATTMGDEIWLYGQAKPIPGFTSDNPSGGCPGTTITISTYDSNPNTPGWGDTYLWNPPAGNTNSSITVNPLVPADYTVSLTDNTNYCVGTGTYHQNVYPAPTVNVGADHFVCRGLKDTLHAVGNNILYYQWSPTNNMTGYTNANPVITPTATLSYTCTVTSGYGCTANDAVMISSPVTTADAGPVSYTICSGVPLQLTGTGTATGTNHLYYNWTPNTAINNANIYNPIVTPLVTTTYKLITTDSVYGCHGKDSVKINVNPTPTIDAGLNHTVCGGLHDTLHATGTNISTYNWLPNTAMTGNTTANPVITPTVTVTYTCNVASSLGCTAKDSIKILSTVITADAGPTSYTLCSGNSQQLNGTGTYIGNNHLTYNWTPATGINNTSIANPLATPPTTTMYQLTTTDSIYGCHGRDSINIIVNPTPTINIGPDHLVCGSLIDTLHAIGTNISTYNWLPTTSMTGSTTANPVLTPTVTVTYTCTVSSAQACVARDTVTIMSSLTTADAGPASYSTCLGSSLTLNGIGGYTGNNHIHYNWTPTTGLSNPGIAHPSLTPLNTTMYHLTVVDSLYGCVAKDSINIIVGPVTINANDLTLTCANSGTLTATPQGNFVGPLTYNWTPSSHLSATNTASVTASPIVSTNYFVTVTTANGCSGSDSSIVTINAPNYNLGFTAVAQLLTAPPFIAQFSNTTPSLSSYTFTWNFGDGTIQQTNNATVFHTYAYNGNYDVTLTAVNNSTGCSQVLFQGGFIYSTGGTACNLSAAISTTQGTAKCQGDTILVSANTGSGYTYQWNLNGVAISGATAATYGTTLGGNYSVSVGNGTCTVTSQPVSISFVSPPALPTITPNGNINLCGSGSVFLTASSGFTSYHWNTGATTQNITATQSGVYSVTVTGASSSCKATGFYTLNASVMAPTPICAVGVDSASSKNLVIWNPPVTTQIDSFIVYKEGTIANQFNRIGAVWYHAFSTFLDINSNPQQQAERYELGIRDSCGILSSLSTYHKTIHLTINQGVGSTWNLLWNNYEGFNFGTFNIYRGTTSTNMTLLTSLASTNFSYTDLTPPSGLIYYQIEAVNPNGCAPATRQYSYSSTRSNIVNDAGLITIGLNALAINDEFTLYPNPATEELNILFKLVNGNSKKTIDIMDITGRIIITKQTIVNSGDLEKINVSELSQGVYMVKIKDENSEVTERIVKTK